MTLSFPAPKGFFGGFDGAFYPSHGRFRQPHPALVGDGDVTLEIGLDMIGPDGEILLPTRVIIPEQLLARLDLPQEIAITRLSSVTNISRLGSSSLLA